MSIFGAIVRTVTNVALLPVDAVKDVLTLGGTLTEDESALERRVRRIKAEADTDYDERREQRSRP